MKNSVLFITTVGLLLASTFSNIMAQGFDIGLRLGVNTPLFPEKPSPIRNSWNTVGIIAGIQGDYWFNSTWGLSGQIFYIEKKVTVLNVDLGTSGASIPPLLPSHSYIEIPIEVKVRGGNYIRLHPYIYVGIAVGILSSERVVSINSEGPLYSSTTDVGVIIGAGLDYVFPSNMSLYVDAGLRSSTNNIGSPIDDIRFCAGILLPI